MLALRRFAWVLALLLPMGCSKVKSTIHPSDATLFNKEWAKLQAEGARNPHPTELPDEDAQSFFRGLEDIATKLDSGPMGALAAGPPPTTREAQTAWLLALQPLLRDISGLLGQPAIKAAIQSGRSLAQRPSIRLDIEPRERFSTPPLPRTLRLIRPLCVSAVYCAFSPETSNECVRSLVQALDLIQLLDDGSLPALRRSSVLGSEVLKALQKMLPRTNVPAEFLRSQLEPRLALAMTPGRLERTLSEEAAYRMAIGKSVVTTPKSEANVFGAKYLGCKPNEAVQRCLDFLSVNRSVRTYENICNLVAQEGASGRLPNDIQGIEEFHNFEIACHLARLALAVNEFEWKHGNWPEMINELEGFEFGIPRQPCNARRVDYELSFQGMRLVAFDRVALNKKADMPLHDWSWSRKDLNELNARR